jgi:5'-nucleotidase
MKFKIYYVLLITGIVSSCSTAPTQKSEIVSDSKHSFTISSLQTEGAFHSKDPDEVTIAVVGMNDFHGHLFAKERKLPNGEIVKSGGSAALASMMKTLKKEMQDRVLIVDAGDEWQGTIESNTSQGARVVDFFNRIGVQVAAVGNHEFDFTLNNLKARAKQARYPYVTSNVFEKSTKKRVQWPNVYPSRLFKIAGIPIGVIGVSTISTPSATRYEEVKHLDFVDATKPVIDESKKLREAGAQAVLVTAHAGTVCADGEGSEGSEGKLKSWYLRDAHSAQGSCLQDQEIAKLANSVGAANVDGIVAGHTHQPIHHYLSGVPVIQGEAYNQYFNILYLTFSKRTKKLLTEKTKIEGLIPICETYFEGTSHCDVRLLPKDSNPKQVPAYFHGQAFKPDPSLDRWLEPVFQLGDRARKRILGKTVLPLHHQRDAENPFGNWVADVMKEVGGSDFSLANSGGIRTSLDAGNLTEDGIYRALPFDNFVQVITLTGKELKLLFRVATSGAHGYPSFSGLVANVRPLNVTVEGDDLNANGKIESWEMNRLLDLKLADGTALQDEKSYTLTTYDFITQGGDDFNWFFEKHPPKQLRPVPGGYSRDLLRIYLKKHPVVNTPDHPFYDAKNPRIVILGK